MTWYETSYVSLGPRSVLEEKTVRIRFSDLCGLGQAIPNRKDFISYWCLNSTRIVSILNQVDTAIILIGQTSQINYESHLLWLTVIETCYPNKSPATFSVYRFEAKSMQQFLVFFGFENNTTNKLDYLVSLFCSQRNLSTLLWHSHFCSGSLCFNSSLGW